jgi:hypothetical protein
MTLPAAIRYHWTAELARFYLKRSSKLSFLNIGLELDVSPSDVIIDCGANVGDITSVFARTRATVYAFEPNPFCDAVLERRFKPNP